METDKWLDVVLAQALIIQADSLILSLVFDRTDSEKKKIDSHYLLIKAMMRRDRRVMAVKEMIGSMMAEN